MTNWEITVPSTLSSNDVTLNLLADGRLEITFDGGDTSWGEALTLEDTNQLANALANR
jgi:hypothetical protein